jgi:hypothetical protein
MNYYSGRLQYTDGLPPCPIGWTGRIVLVSPE